MHPIHVGPYESLIFQLILDKLKETMIIKRTINSSAYLQAKRGGNQCNCNSCNLYSYVKNDKLN